MRVELQQFADQGGYPIGLFAHPRQCLVALVPLTCQLDLEAEPGHRLNDQGGSLGVVCPWLELHPWLRLGPTPCSLLRLRLGPASRPGRTRRIPGTVTRPVTE